MTKDRKKTGHKRYNAYRRLSKTESIGSHLTEFETRKKPYQLEYMEKLNAIRRENHTEN